MLESFREQLLFSRERLNNVKKSFFYRLFVSGDRNFTPSSSAVLPANKTAYFLKFLNGFTDFDSSFLPFFRQLKYPMHAV